MELNYYLNIFNYLHKIVLLVFYLKQQKIMTKDFVTTYFNKTD